MQILHAGSTDPKPVDVRSGKAEAEVAAPKQEVEMGEGMHYYQTGTWWDLLPFRKLSPEEWESYQRKKKADFQAK